MKPQGKYAPYWIPNSTVLILFKWKQTYKNSLFLKQLPRAQKDKDDIDDDEGHGAAMLSVKSHVKL